ncbi:hypothetical protein NEMBOFW57_000070 [Staphylotrichum longicolle]|uniref:Uncharacterized protein n=1 Tax=Staphylotrichum longicolle TaxID=669026 RepID=A0AAD4EZ29_9PEZI|nr:hypothetical protein NEMBOFW57_000070 [Staphylotrichum longicolle]
MELVATTSSAVSPPAPRRGRREKPWPPGKQKKLLRLYVCTQSERLPLVRILERLKDGSFDPRQRNSHKHLKNLLPDRRIDDWRPRDLSTMLIRVRFLRSVRAERRIRNRKVRRRIETRPQGFFPHDTTEAPGTRMSLDQQPPVEQQPVFFAHSPSTASPVTVKQSESPGSTPQAISSGSAGTADPGLGSLEHLVRNLQPGAVLVLGILKGRKRERLGRQHGPQQMTREEFLSMLQEKPRKGGKSNNAPAMGLFKSKYTTANPTTEDLNAALVRMCCAAAVGQGPPGCVHDRLSKAIDAQKNDGPNFRHFTVTEEEANMVDKYGNSLLHVAARWGARVSILLMILKRTDDIQMVNHRGETFLHVFDPPDNPRMRPISFLNLIRTLRSRGFDFCHRDVDKHTFLHHLVARREFPIETLYHVFREVGHGAARFLVANKSANGERLWHSIRKNLEKSAPKLHRIFGDEVEFIRRYLPEFSEGRAPSTADTSTIGSDGTLSIHPTEVAPRINFTLDPNESNAQNVRRSPVMKLLRRAASGRGLSDVELTSKLESIFEVATKQTDFDMQAYLGKRDTEGNTALHYASEFGLVPAVQFLCAKGASVNVFNNCGNTPLQLVKFAIQRTDVRSDIHMEARYLRCAVLLLEQGAFDQSKLVSERSVIFPYDVFDGSERSISNLVRQGVASPPPRPALADVVVETLSCSPSSIFAHSSTFAGCCSIGGNCNFPTACAKGTPTNRLGGTWECEPRRTCYTMTVYGSYPSATDSWVVQGCANAWSASTVYRSLPLSMTMTTASPVDSATGTATGAASTAGGAGAPAESSTGGDTSGEPEHSQSLAWIAGVVIGCLAVAGLFAGFSPTSLGSFINMLVLLPLLASLASGAAIVPRQSATQVVRLNSIENVAVRSNGQILATNMNAATLYAIDPVAKTSTTALTVTGASGLSGIGEYAPDVFAVIGGKGIYKVDFTSTPPKSSLIKTISEANNLNGLAVFDNSSVLVADAGKGAVYKLDVNTGAYAVVLQDATMAPSGGIPFGIDGIKYRDGVVWYTNIFKNSFHKVAVDPATAKPAGAYTTLWTNLMGDDLCFGPNGKIYVATNSKNSLVEVDPAVGKPTSVGSVTGSTSCAFGRTAKDANVAYVGAGQGVFAVTVKV